MLLDAVLADTQYSWLGTERDKRTYFPAPLEKDLREHWYPHLTFGEGPEKTTRFFPTNSPSARLAMAAGDTCSCTWSRATCLTSFGCFSCAMRTSQGHRRMDDPPPRPAPFRKAAAVYRYAVRDAFATPLMPHQVDELDWFFRARQGRATEPAPDPDLTVATGAREVRRGALPRAPAAMGTRGYLHPLVGPVHDSQRQAATRRRPCRIH